MWHSLVARFVRDEEAAGSNPVIPTRKSQRHVWLAGVGGLFFVARNNHFTAYPLQSSPPCKKGIRPHAKNIPREAARKLSHGGCSIFWVFTQNFRYAFAATACSTAWRASSALMRMSRGLLPWLGPTMPSSAIVSMRRAARV